MPNEAKIRTQRRDFLDALDAYVDARCEFKEAERQLAALEYRLGRPELKIPNGDQALEEIRKVRAGKEREYREKRFTLGQKLELIAG